MKFIRTVGFATLFSVATALYPVSAADLGGNCCADLEERVAELEATTARKGNRRVSLEVSGHINEAVLYQSGFGDTERGEWTIIPNTQSQSRFRFKGKAKINSDWEAGFLLEVGVGGFDDEDGATNRDLGVRHSALYVKSRTLGSLWLGQTSQATDGIAEICLGCTNPFTQMSFAPFGSALGADPITDIFTNFDGGRTGVVKYVSPVIGGFSLSASWSGEDVEGTDPEWDAALRYAGEFGAIRIAAGIGIRHEQTDFEGEVISGSGSIQHTPSGVFISLAGAQSKGDGGTFESRAYWITGGVAAKTTPMGKTTIYAEYGDIYDIKLLGFDVAGQHQVYGAGINQAIDAAAMDIYLGYRHVKAEAIGVDSADVIVIGGKIKF